MLFTKSRLSSSQISNFSENRILKNSIATDSELFDIFLSHSYDDKKYIYELYNILESYGYKVYVDWLIDKGLDRNHVTKETAEKLRLRMNQCKCFLYATSKNASSSKWMPWELGYFDGFKKGNVAIIPIADNNYYSFDGQEYLKLYPYLDEATTKVNNQNQLWINESTDKYVLFKDWLAGTKPYLH